MTFDCPYCGQNLDADSDLAGQSVKCPSCENDLVVPRAVHASKPPERLRNCPFCSELIKAAAIKCKHCGNMLDGSAGQDSRGDEFWVKALDRRGMEEIVSVRAESHAQALKRVRQRGYFPIEVPTAVSSSAVAAEKDQGARGPGPLRIALNKWVSGLIVILLLIRGGAWLIDRFRGPSEGEGEPTNQATASAGPQTSPQESVAQVAGNRQETTTASSSRREGSESASANSDFHSDIDETQAYYQSMRSTVEALSDVRAGFSLGINRIDYQRLLRRLQSSVTQHRMRTTRIDTDCENQIDVCLQACVVVETFWAMKAECDTAEDWEKPYKCFPSVDNRFRQMMAIFPSTKAVVIHTEPSGRFPGGWEVSIADILPPVMADTGSYIDKLLATYGRKVR